MSTVIAQRMTARIEGDFVVFLIGMRVNKPWKVWKWAPVARQMPRMLAELGEKPELGLLHARTHFGLPNILVVQYWRSFEHLHKYAAGAPCTYRRGALSTVPSAAMAMLGSGTKAIS
jgi:hypothetical protein